MNRLPCLALAALAVVLAGCQTTTTTQYRVAGASGHRQRIDHLLRRFAQREMMMPVKPSEVQPPALFAHYRNTFPVIDLRAFDRRETIEVHLSEPQSITRNPSGRFDSLEQKLRNELGGAFGTDVHYETVVTRGPQ